MFFLPVKRLLTKGIFILHFVICSVVSAQVPAIFVKFSTTQVATNSTPTVAATTNIAAPGSGWNFSAAAPVAGDTWNVIMRPNPLIAAGASDGVVGQFVCNSASNIALKSASGLATDARLTTWIDVQNNLVSGTSTEPRNVSVACDAVLGPSALMGGAWRIYSGANGTIHRLTGLPPGAHCYVYAYGSTTTAGQGARFVLNISNNVAGVTTTNFIDMRGGNSGNVFVTNGTKIVPSAPAAPNTVSTTNDVTTWGRLHAVVDSAGGLELRTAAGANGQYFQGYQIVPFPVPTITQQPNSSVTATIGGSAILTAVASGDGMLTYQWRKNGVNLASGASGNGSTYAGATSTTLTITGVSSADNGSYELVVTNEGGAVTSTASVLTVTSSAVAPSIVTQPASTSSAVGQSVSFTVQSSGTSPLTFRWQRSPDNDAFTDISGASSPTLSIPAVNAADAGYYRVIVSNSVGTITSAVASLVVAPILSTPPVSAVVPAGSSKTIQVLVEAGAGSPEQLVYVWKRNGIVVPNGNGITGATTANLVVSSFSAALSGYYTVTAYNSAGSVTSSPVYVGVPSTQNVTFAPGSQAIGVPIDQQLRLAFPSPPKLGKSGGIRIHDAETGQVVLNYNSEEYLSYTLFGVTVVNAAKQSVQGKEQYYHPVAVYGNEVWVTLPVARRLSYGKTYYVTMDEAFLLDSSNAAVAAITDPMAWRFSTKANGPATPTATSGPAELTVALDGTGDFATVQGALDWVPQNNVLPRTIRIKSGIYFNNVYLAQNRNFVNILGEGSRRNDVVLFYPYAAEVYGDGGRGMGSVRIDSNDVTVRNLTIDNGVYLPMPNLAGADYPAATAFPGIIQTLVTTGKRLVFDNALIKGGQDTLYVITGIAYFYNSEIWGSVDFIYGGGLGIFDRCEIVQIRSTGAPICAPDTPLSQPYGLVFLSCRFPRALVANGYPYDVGPSTTIFMRPWRKDGATAIINSQLGNHITTKGWGEWSGSENTCRAVEYGSTMIGGGAAASISDRQAAGAYWLNTIDPDYLANTSLDPNDPLLAHPGGTANRQPLSIAPQDYNLSAIAKHPYFQQDIATWVPDVNAGVVPTIIEQPQGARVNQGASALFSVLATGSAHLTYQWFKNGEPVSGAINSRLMLPAVQAGDAGAYTCKISNEAGQTVSAVANLSVLSAFAQWAERFSIDSTQPDYAKADPDGDGINNMWEFVLGGNPLRHDIGILPSTTMVETNGQKQFIVQFDRVVGSASSSLEESTDLVRWSPIVSGLNGAQMQVTPFIGEVINVDINNYPSNHYTGVGVAADSGTTWNSFLTPGAAVGTLYAVKDSMGGVTPVNVTIASSGSGFSVWGNATAGTPNPALLMSDYLFGNSYTVTLSNLPEGVYQLYVYAHGDADTQVSTVTVNAATGGGVKSTMPTGNNSFRNALAASGNGSAYVSFTPTVTAAGTLQFTVASYLNGFQVARLTNPDFERVRYTVPVPTDVSRYFVRLRASE